MVLTQGKKEVAESVVLCPLNSTPTAEEGKMIYDNATKVIKFYNGTEWKLLGSCYYGNTCLIYPDYQATVCSDYKTVLCYEVLNTSTVDFTTRLISPYYPATTEWACNYLTRITPMCCCKVVFSPIYSACMIQSSIVCGCDTCNCLINNFDCHCIFLFSCHATLWTCDTLEFDRIYKLCNQCSTSNICISMTNAGCTRTTCIVGSVCLYVCHFYKVTVTSTDNTTCDIFLYNHYYAVNVCCVCNFNTTHYVCVCPANNCIYSNGISGNVAFDFGTHGYLKCFAVCRYAWGCVTTCGGVCACVLTTNYCITGNNLTEYCKNCCIHKTSCANLSLPDSYKMVMTKYDGMLYPIGTELKINYCIPGICNFTDQRNSQKQCFNPGTNCITNIYSEFCQSGLGYSDPAYTCFNYCCCVSGGTCIYCLSCPCYTMPVIPCAAPFCYQIYAWKEVS